MGNNGTESFNEQNVAQDFKEIMDHASRIRTILINGSTDIDENIGNGSMNDAYSGQAASAIKSQWSDLAATFEAFLQNFNNWYDQSVEAAKANQQLQQSTSTVEGVDVQ